MLSSKAQHESGHRDQEGSLGSRGSGKISANSRVTATRSCHRKEPPVERALCAVNLKSQLKPTLGNLLVALSMQFKVLESSLG